MRCLKATGLLLALGFLTARSFAEELQWRAATPIKTGGTSAATEPPAISNAAEPQSTPSQVTSLSKPVPVNNVIQVDYSGAVPLVRGKNMADDVRILPAGPPLIVDSPTVGGGDKPKTEVIPIKPKEITPSTPMQDGSISMFGEPSLCDDCCCGCSGDCCPCFDDCCCCCRDRGCFWFSAEGLAWGVSKQRMPPLLATFPNGTSEIAILQGSATGASTLVDENNLPGNFRAGARFTAGFWLPCCDCLGLEASYFFLGKRTSSAFFNSPNGSPILAIPFVDAATGQQRFGITAHPGPPIPVGGSFAFDASSFMWGAELNLRQKLCCGPCYFIDLLYGYRHIQLQDSINIVDVESPVQGQSVTIWENFSTRNLFNGGQIGIEGEWHFRPRWFVGGQFKIALGNMTQTVTINGVAIPPFDPFGNSNLTLHAENSNIGKFTRNTFAVAPEAELKLGFDVTDHLRVWVGYDVLYLSSVVRAGDQIDTTFSFPPGQGPRPAVLFRTTSWVGQGVNLGVQYIF